jgi:hypothetical protein
MQSKRMLISNPRNRWTLALVPLAASLVLATTTRLFAGPTSLGPESRPQPVVVAPDPMSLHVADADKDTGPGGAESMLAQHPGANR